MGGRLRGVGNDRRFRRFLNPVLAIGLLSVGVEQGCHSAIRHGVLVAVEGVTRQPHQLAGPRDVAQFGGQVQQADLVTNDILIETTHGVTPWRLRAVSIKIRTSIKTGNPASRQGLDCQIRSELLQFSNWHWRTTGTA